MNHNGIRMRHFFIRLGFSITHEESSESFGNFLVEACSIHICIKGVRDRSIESIELRAFSDPDEWFILNIVMSYVLHERRLVEEIGLEEQMNFVEAHLDKLEQLFSEDVYSDTKSQLRELQRMRGKIMFPDWYE